MIRAFSRRLWHSGGLATIAAVGGRSVAYLIPIPFLSAHFSEAIVALWFLIISFQSLTALAIGNLPVILMHMVSHAHAGKDGQRSRMADVVRGITRIFNTAVILYVALAILVFTPLLWRQIGLTGDPGSALVAWGLFILGTAFRIKTMVYSTYLLGLDRVADVRRAESISWLIGGFAGAAGLLIWPNLVFAMALVQSSAIMNFLAMRRLALQTEWKGLLAENASEGTNIWPEVLPRAVKGSIGIVMAALTVYGSSIIYAQFGDSASIAAFSFTVTLYGLISQIAVSHTLAALPSMARSYAGKQEGKLKAIASRANWIGLGLYLALAALVWASYSLVTYVFPTALPAVDPNLYVLFFAAYLPVRYASFHLHFYTITNDIRWHVYQTGVGVIFFPLIFILGAASVVTYPVALFLANMAFAVPYARYLTWKKLNFNLQTDKGGTFIFVLATACAGIFVFVNS